VDRSGYPAGVLEALTPRERIDYVTEEDRYSALGWTVLSVEPAPARRFGTLVMWDVEICATGSLPR
jgi:hypothetical protein